MEIEKNKIDMKRLVLIVLAAVIGSIIGKYIIDGINGKQNIFDKNLVATANQLNMNLPIMLDSETRLDSTMALPGKKFAYYYTLVNFSVDELDVENFESIMKPTILNSIKTNSDLQEFRDNKVTMVYLYKDKSGNEIIKFEFTHDDYN
jgi:hypothetical protein